MSVLTYHNDLARTGQNLSESELTPASVSSGQFDRLFSYPVDGQVYAQPLYLPGVLVPGKGIHNIVFIVTEHDSVYAFDADNSLAAPLWHASFLNAAQGITSASAAELTCDMITPEVGITATPVIDASTGTIYIVAMTQEGPNRQFVHRLHALDVRTGAERPGSPVEIQASVAGAGNGNTTVVFEPRLYKERAGLLLVNGTLYTAWSSHCDAGNYHGWVLGYDARTLQQTAVFSATPNWDAGAFWQGGAAPAADSSGNIFIVSANGTFDANRGGLDFGDSVLKLSSGANFALADYFTPYNAAELSQKDLDLGSSGALLLPGAAGSAAHPHLLVAGSKTGVVYLLDRDNLGRFQQDGDTQVVQRLEGAVGPLFGIPAYFNHTLYFSATHDQLKALSIRDGVLASAPVSASVVTFPVFGTVPSISALGAAQGIVWTIDAATQLHAFDATDLERELYRGSTGSFIKFSTPTIANGKVYAGTSDSLVVFGLRDVTPASIHSVVSHAGSISLQGSNLAPGAEAASSEPWPRLLGGVSVFINGVAAPVGFVSPTEIDAQIPDGTRGGPATLNIITGNRVLPPIELTLKKGPRLK
ncbi:MAG TPA: hypothetical protein VFW44_20145 [Bryobacteraceae bacterium]|nr:hypothetical protein [Bryobacteraceae bacterium]